MSVVINEDVDLKSDDNEEKDDKKDETNDLSLFLKKNGLEDIEELILKEKLNLYHFKHLNENDIDDLCKSLNLSTTQRLRFKTSLKSLNNDNNNNNNDQRRKSQHYKSTPSSYQYSVDLKEFYSTTQTITVIGGSRVGKSSIKDVIMGRKFNKDKFPTIRMMEKPELFISKIKRFGDNKIYKTNNNKNDSDKIEVKYHIWDCPGQKALEHIPPLYITGAMAVLIVYDITDKVTYNRAKDWIKYLCDEAKGYDKVLVIGNKKDLNSKREISYEEANNFCMQYGFNYLETSAKNGDNINTLKKWLDSHTQNKVENKIKKFKQMKINDKKDLDWSAEKIKLELPVIHDKQEEEEASCCDF